MSDLYADVRLSDLDLWDLVQSLRHCRRSHGNLSLWSGARYSGDRPGAKMSIGYRELEHALYELLALREKESHTTKK